MQKSLITIALALTLTCVFGAWTATNYVKAPQRVADDNDTNFTNVSSLSLASITIDDLYLFSTSSILNPINASANNWILWYRKLESKSLTVGANGTASFVAPQPIFFYNNYAYAFGLDSDSGAPNLRMYQAPLASEYGPQRIQLSNNTNTSFTPIVVGGPILIGKTFYVFYYACYQRVNVTNFVIGSSTLGIPEFTLSSTFDTLGSLSVTWGEALNSNQIFAVWVENGTLKDSLLDVSKGTVGNATIVLGYNANYVCYAYSTDKKWYGELCQHIDYTAGIAVYYARTQSNASLALLANYTTKKPNLSFFVPYGPYLALVFQDSSLPSVNYGYEIWALDTLTRIKSIVQFLTIDSNSSMFAFRVPSGGLYTLLYNNKQGNGTITSVQVGLLLGSSYLASVIGFLLTIIVGFLLF